GRLYAGGRDGTITEWDLATGLDCRTLATSVPNPTLNTKKSVTALCTLPNSSRLFSASEDGSLTFWNLATAQPIRSYRAHDGYVHAVCVSPEGRLYSGGADRLINEWDVDTGRRHWVLAGHTRWILALTACPASANNGRLYSAGNDNTVRVWDLASGKCIMVLEEHRDWVTSLCLGRDLLYSCSRDGSVKVWDTGSGRCLRSLRGHSSGAAVRAVTVAAGRLFSAGDDKAVVEWDVRQGRIVRTLTEHEEAVVALCAGADGKLFTGSIDGTVKVWEIGELSLSSFGLARVEFE
ncbi:WD40-repeat-containing domain protein, partial [Zopfochytrium polystomum]